MPKYDTKLKLGRKYDDVPADVASGATSRRKTIIVEGVSVEAASRAVAAALDREERS